VTESASAIYSSRVADTTDDAPLARDHLANQRTLLAWIRTSLALMGLGFVVARFGLFLRETAANGQPPQPGSAFSAPIGIALVVAGVLAVVVSTIRFLQTRREISQQTFKPVSYAELALVVIVVLAGAALIVYLAVTG
jgi:putative membrane protein